MKLNFNNYLSYVSWGCIAAILHQLYWTSVIYSNNERNFLLHSNNEKNGYNDTHIRQSHDILQLRMLHYLLMCFGCLIFTILSIFLSYFCKKFSIFGYQNASRQNRAQESGSMSEQLGLLNMRSNSAEGGMVDQNMYSGYTTSYQQHSSSADERKYMQQQLMQFNKQMSRSIAHDDNDNYEQYNDDRQQRSQKHFKEDNNIVEGSSGRNRVLQSGVKQLPGQKQNNDLKYREDKKSKNSKDRKQSEQQQQQQYNPFSSERQLYEDGDNESYNNQSLQSDFNTQVQQQSNKNRAKITSNIQVDDDMKQGLLENYKNLEKQIFEEDQHNDINNKQDKQHQLRKNSSQQIRGSKLNFNGDIFYSRDEKNLQLKGTFSWSIVFHNYKLHLLFLTSSILNVTAQIKLATSIDHNLIDNLPVKSTQLYQDIVCFLQVNSFSIILVIFAIFYHFLIYPDTPHGKAQKKEENLANGIYMILIAIISCVILNLVIHNEIFESNTYQTLIAWILIGFRMLMIRAYFDLLPINQRPTCFVINMLQIWGEFAIFLIYLMVFYPGSIFYPNNPILFSLKDIIQEAVISFFYMLSLITFNAAVINQSLFSFVNVFNLATTKIVFEFIIYYKLLNLRFLIIFILGLFAFIVLKFCGQLVVKLYQNCFSNRQQKGMVYGKKFQEDQYERLLPTPYMSVMQENQYNTDNSCSDPQLRHQNQIHQKYQPSFPRPIIRSNFEYYIVENEVSLLLKKRPCLDLHYKFNSIQHFSLRFYAINSIDLSQSQDTNNYMERQHEDEQRIFLKAIENYQRKIYQ